MFFRQLLLGILIATGMMLPSVTHAKDTLLWDFTKNFSASEWTTQQITATPTADGLNIQAVQQGGLFKEISSSLPADTITLTFSKGQNADMLLLWHRKSASTPDLVQLPFSLGPNPPPQTMTFDMTVYKEWGPDIDAFGIAFAAGTDVTLKSVEFRKSSAVEKLTTAWKSFWTFDQMKVYSINFLWGPLLIFNDARLQTLFDGMPPQGMSINRFYYIAIVLAGLIVALWAWWSGKKNGGVPWKKSLLLFGSTVGLLWITYDIRMGAELLSYSIHDYRTFISKPAGEKVLRGYLNFYDMLYQSLPILKEDDRFVFLTVDGTPLPKITRYMAYPSHMMEPWEPLDTTVKHWLVFKREDITLNEKNELTVGSQVISSPGKILKKFDESSFLFETL
jgi:hypothetical protein